eukprot:5165592-Alexandrium_andersonii.AAC.1
MPRGGTAEAGPSRYAGSAQQPGASQHQPATKERCQVEECVLTVEVLGEAPARAGDHVLQLVGLQEVPHVPAQDEEHERAS